MILFFLMSAKALDSLTDDEWRIFVLVDILVTTILLVVGWLIFSSLWEAWYGWPLF